MTEDPNRIVVCEYDATWPDRFDVLAARVRSILVGIVRRVEHVGSTAVPGLAAKPVVDLDVVVQPMDVLEAIRRLQAIGYAHEGDLGIAGREAFRWPAGERRHHLYLVTEGAAELRRHLAFRDALRADPSLCDRYAELKRSLAASHGGDRSAYNSGKSAFVQTVLEARKKWRSP